MDRCLPAAWLAFMEIKKIVNMKSEREYLRKYQ